MTDEETQAGATGEIMRTLELEAEPERVWRALTEPAELSAWFGHAAELDPRPGGAGWFEWPKDGRFLCRVEEVEPPRRLAWRWARDRDTAVDAGPSTLVEWTLEPRPGGGTRLRLRESGFLTEAWWKENSEGWDAELGELAAHLATRVAA